MSGTPDSVRVHLDCIATPTPLLHTYWMLYVPAPLPLNNKDGYEKM